MNGRERLIELLKEADKKWFYFEDKANYLLESGVTILPCKAGDTIYSIWQDDEGVLQIDETEVLDVSVKMIWIEGGGFSVDSIGKSDFFSREEAEKEISRRCKR